MKQLRPTLFVTLPSAQADQTELLLGSMGLTVRRADNICLAEMYAEAQYFEVAVYAQTLTPEEQISLARVMRIRWPWIRIVRLVPSRPDLSAEDLFDCSVLSEAQLAACIEDSLAG